MLQAGDEDRLGTNNNLDGEVITGNRFTWNGTYQVFYGGSDVGTSGFVTAINNGAVTVRATANDGSGIYGSIVIPIFVEDFELTSFLVFDISSLHSGLYIVVLSKGKNLRMAKVIKP